MTYTAIAKKTRRTGITLTLPSLGAMMGVRRERRALARMDTTRLADMGISPTDAAREAARPFWDLP